MGNCCDFCNHPYEIVETVGDKSACRFCVEVDTNVNANCDKCGNAFRNLDDGGTLIGDTNQTVCEKCWMET